MVKTKLINFYGGPGSGKSTLASLLQGFTKMHAITPEYTGEYAKDLAFEGRLELKRNDIYMFAKQHQKQYRLNGKVDLIISDSPLMLSKVYRQEKDDIFDALVKQESEKYDNVNFFVERRKEYETRGRQQTKEEAVKIDDKTLTMLEDDKIPYEKITGDWIGFNNVLSHILKQLNTQQQYKLSKV